MKSITTLLLEAWYHDASPDGGWDENKYKYKLKEHSNSNNLVLPQNELDGYFNRISTNNDIDAIQLDKVLNNNKEHITPNHISNVVDYLHKNLDHGWMNKTIVKRLTNHVDKISHDDINKLHEMTKSEGTNGGKYIPRSLFLNHPSFDLKKLDPSDEYILNEKANIPTLMQHHDKETSNNILYHMTKYLDYDNPNYRNHYLTHGDLADLKDNIYEHLIKDKETPKNIINDIVPKLQENNIGFRLKSQNKYYNNLKDDYKQNINNEISKNLDEIKGETNVHIFHPVVRKIKSIIDENGEFVNDKNYDQIMNHKVFNSDRLIRNNYFSHHSNLDFDKIKSYIDTSSPVEIYSLRKNQNISNDDFHNIIKKLRFGEKKRAQYSRSIPAKHHLNDIKALDYNDSSNIYHIGRNFEVVDDKSAVLQDHINALNTLADMHPNNKDTAKRLSKEAFNLVKKPPEDLVVNHYIEHNDAETLMRHVPKPSTNNLIKVIKNINSPNANVSGEFLNYIYNNSKNSVRAQNEIIKNNTLVNSNPIFNNLPMIRNKILDD